MKEIDWVISDDTGLSSLTIWGVMMGAKIPSDHAWRYDPPFDVTDFARCHRLLDMMPEWRERLHEVSDQLPEWKLHIAEWGKLTDLYIKASRTGNYHPLFNRLSKIRNRLNVLWISESIDKLA